MLTRYCMLLALGTVLTAVVTGSQARAQDKLDQYIAESALILKPLVAQANADGFRVLANSGHFGGGWLTQSTTNWVTMHTVKLEAGKTYRFIAAGDADATDVDLRVLDASNKQVAIDDTVVHDAVVDFQPVVAQTYTVQVRLYASRKNQPCACLVVQMQK